MNIGWVLKALAAPVMSLNFIGFRMLVTVTLVVCLLGGVTTQDFNIERRDFTQLMYACIGEEPYREYQHLVATARRNCGGGLDDQDFVSGLANILRNPALTRLSPVQPGAVVVQRPPGVFTPLRGTPGRLLPSQPGAVTLQPGTFPQASGVFSLVDTPSRVTPEAITDSVLPISSPVGPPFPGIRQRRTTTLNLADILQLRENMRARINNFTCVLNNLAVVDANLNLNHPGLTNSVINLPVGRELKRDLLRGISYCMDMTQCLPLEKQQLIVPHKLKRIMEYVKCEKKMRFKACHKHNFRQNLQNMNLGRLPHDGNQVNTVEEMVTLLVEAQSAHEMELI